jgi:hypothetical protein
MNNITTELSDMHEYAMKSGGVVVVLHFIRFTPALGPSSLLQTVYRE